MIQHLTRLKLIRANSKYMITLRIIRHFFFFS